MSWIVLLLNRWWRWADEEKAKHDLPLSLSPFQPQLGRLFSTVIFHGIRNNGKCDTFNEKSIHRWNAFFPYLPYFHSNAIYGCGGKKAAEWLRFARLGWGARESLFWISIFVDKLRRDTWHAFEGKKEPFCLCFLLPTFQAKFDYVVANYQ